MKSGFLWQLFPLVFYPYIKLYYPLIYIKALLALTSVKILRVNWYPEVTCRTTACI